MKASHLQVNVEIHAVDTNTRVVLDTQINVLTNTKSKVTSIREVPLSQLVFLDSETTLENFLRLGTTDSDVNGNLFITTNTKRTDSVASLTCTSAKISVLAV